MYLIYSFIHTMHLLHAPTPVRRTARCNPGTGSTTAYYDLLTVPEVRPLNSAVPASPTLGPVGKVQTGLCSYGIPIIVPTMSVSFHITPTFNHRKSEANRENPNMSWNFFGVCWTMKKILKP